MKKITLLAMVLVLCLAAIGVGYAKWTDEITLNGTVSTGSVDLDIVGYSGTWVYKDLVTHEMVVLGGPSDNTDYEYIASAYAAPCDVEPDLDNDIDCAVMVWENLFPTCFGFTADVKFHYVGTIPGVVSIDFDFVGEDYEWLLDPEMATVEVYAWIYNSEDQDRIGMVVDEGTQLHFCDYIQLDVTIDIIQMPDNMLKTASAVATITVEQWAECPPNDD